VTPPVTPPVTTAATLFDAAARLDLAQRDAVAVEQLGGEVSVADAYRIQHEVLARRVERGERLVGTKLGFTSAAKMAQMGVSEIIAGQLTDAMQVADGAAIDLSRFIHPRIEPEVCFRIAADVDLDDPATDLSHYVAAVAPALEIIDSRYRDFVFSLSDVIADNASAAAFVVGAWHDIDALDDDREVLLVVDGVDVELGSTAAIMGDPMNALRALGEMAGKYGLRLAAGDVILAGAATAAVPFTASHVEARVTGLGVARVSGAAGDE